VATSSGLDAELGARLFFKCENLQKVAAFKYRGASNTLAQLSPEALARGVATHSSGNHAAALALAARVRGAEAHIVMPRDAPAAKVEAVRAYGGQIRFCEPTQAAREQALRELVEQTGATFVHPYADPRVVAGQGTAAYELLTDLPDLDFLLVPVGGGGLLSGSALASRGLSPRTQVWGCEPERANDAFLSFRDKRHHPAHPPSTLCDGLLTALSPEVTLPIILREVDGILTASEDSILLAMKLIWQRMKLVVEPSGAIGLACLMEQPERFRGKRVGIILSGGNLDLNPMFSALKARSDSLASS